MALTQQEREGTGADGIITKSQGGFYWVRTPGGDLVCRGRGLFRKTDTVLVVGDRVTVQPTVTPGEGTIVDLLPRKNSLVRPPVANLDRLALVVSAVQPSPNTLVMDTLTAIAAQRNIDVVLVFTKTDLGDVGELADLYGRAGFRVYAVNSLTGEGTEPLKALFSQGLTAFCGNSGAGKSSLLNALFPGLGLATGEISRKLGRGRHTTRHVELFAAGEGLIADTPGFSAVDFLRFGRMLAADLAPCFVEFRPYLDKCRFNGCSHRVEQGCAVLAAVEAGDISQSRHSSYLALYDQLKDIKEWQLDKPEAQGEDLP